MGGGKKGKAVAVAKGKAVAVAKGKADDDAFFAEAIAQAKAERAALAAQADAAAAAAAKVARAAAAEAKAASARLGAARPEDKPAMAEMPGLVLPTALSAEPALLQMLQRTALATPQPSASPSAAEGPKDFSKETPRERELRMREVRAKMLMARKAYAQRRGGKKALEAAAHFTPPAVYSGDETADEIATRPQLIHEHVGKYAKWLVKHMRETGLLEGPKCPAHFALLFRFDTTLDPVCRHPKSKLGSQVDVLITLHKNVLFYLWSDHAAGLLAAARNGSVDPTMNAFNVAEILPGGRRPAGLGVRITKLEELASMPYLSEVFYPQGVPAELVLKGLAWGSDLGAEGAAEATERALAAHGDDALDSESDEEEEEASDKTAGEDPTAALIRREIKALGRTRFPLSQPILDVFTAGHDPMAAAAEAEEAEAPALLEDDDEAVDTDDTDDTTGGTGEEEEEEGAESE